MMSVEFVGQNVNDASVMDALNKKYGPNLRVVPPNTGVSMQYIAARRNVHVDKDGKITRITKG